MLPMGLGYVEGVTHDYIRHGTTTLFATLNIASGEVIGQCKPRHRHQEFLQFLKQVEQNVPQNLDVHIILITMQHTSMQQSNDGSRSTNVGMCILRLRILHGSIKLRSGSIS